MTKYHKNNFYSWMTYFTLLLWPILILYNTFYTYYSFDINFLVQYGINNRGKLMIFLVTGAMGLNFFFSMVQSAWQMSYERQNGTLEVIFMTPANKLWLLYSRALGALLEEMWIFSFLSVFIILFYNGLSVKIVVIFLISFFVLLVSSVVWGGFMNAIFLFSRDATFLFNLLDSPMDLFSGTRIPTQAFPLWGQVISSIFPLTYCLHIIRTLFRLEKFEIEELFKLGIVLTVIIMLTILIEWLANINMRRNGNCNFY